MVILTSKLFKDKIYDFDKYNTWHYKGDKPSIISAYKNNNELDYINILFDLIPLSIDLYVFDIKLASEITLLLEIKSTPIFIFIPLLTAPEKALGALNKKLFLDIINNLFNINDI